MSHFYGTLLGARGPATRCGSKASGLHTTAAAWGGAILVSLYHDKNDGKDHFVVEQIPWQGSGIREIVAQGELGGPARHV